MSLSDSERKRALAALGEFKLKYPDYPIVLASVSGSHSFGWNTPESDIDIRGAYLAPTEKFFEFGSVPDTIEFKVEEYNAEFQLHELQKFVGLLIQPNLNMMDAVIVPPEHILECDPDIYKRLEWLADESVSKSCYPHIQGMIIHMKKHRLTKYNEYDPKKQLYIFREIMRGIVMMQQGKIMNNIMALRHLFPLKVSMLVQDLVLKKTGHEFLTDNEILKINEIERELETELINSKEFGDVRERPHDSLKKDAQIFIKSVRRKNYEEMK
jgi:predicted nucleotidyltransferase